MTGPTPCGFDAAIIGVNDFGQSAPGSVVMREFGFTPEHVVDIAKRVLKKVNSKPGVTVALEPRPVR